MLYYMAQYSGYDWCITCNAPKTRDGQNVDENEAFMILCPLYMGIATSDLLSYGVIKGEFVTNFHLQGFIQFKESQNKRDVIAWLREISDGLECHAAKRLGTPEQAANYCKKPETAWNGFELKEWGKLNTVDRHKVAEVRKALKGEQRCRHRWEVMYLDTDTHIVHCTICKIEQWVEDAAEHEKAACEVILHRHGINWASA